MRVNAQRGSRRHPACDLLFAEHKTRSVSFRLTNTYESEIAKLRGALDDRRVDSRALGAKVAKGGATGAVLKPRRLTSTVTSSVCFLRFRAWPLGSTKSLLFFHFSSFRLLFPACKSNRQQNQQQRATAYLQHYLLPFSVCSEPSASIPRLAVVLC